jgi:hypothetical protein
MCSSSTHSAIAGARTAVEPRAWPERVGHDRHLAERGRVAAEHDVEHVVQLVRAPELVLEQVLRPREREQVAERIDLVGAE